MKIAAVSEDGRTIAQHFGRAPYYVVVAVEGGEVVLRETRAKVGHRDFAGGIDPGPVAKHRAMADAIGDCAALLAGGMGSGAFTSLQAAGIEPVLTDEADIETAALRYAAGDLPNLADRLHHGRGEHHYGHGHSG
ncbi:MAG: dinitrogenase iron-molybdenum cofactor biosynthesis protein [Actinobacteria bacterium]|nr:dinitrogenase iron-molybdenum cofactor biosynthesis protein [Actinomycetota bacterium]